MNGEPKSNPQALPLQPTKYRAFIISPLASDEQLPDTVIDIETAKFETEHLPMAIDLGGDWNDAIDIQDETINLRGQQVLDAITQLEEIPELPEAENYVTDGEVYSIQRMSFGAAIVYLAMDEEITARYRDTFPDDDPTIPVFGVLAIVPVSDL